MKRAGLAVFLALFPLAAFAAIKAEREFDLRPPLPELPAPVLARDRKVWVVCGIGGAVAIALICWPRRKPLVPPPDPFDIAREKIGALRANAGGATPVSVSAIVRRYAAGETKMISELEASLGGK